MLQQHIYTKLNTGLQQEPKEEVIQSNYTIIKLGVTVEINRQSHNIS